MNFRYRRKSAVAFWVALIWILVCSPQQADASSGRREINSSLKNNKRKKKSIELSSSQVRRKDLDDDTASLPSSRPAPLPISVKAILLPRVVSLRVVVKAVCFFTLAISLLGCLKTAGESSVRAIWNLVHNKSDNSPMPNGFLPSAIDDFLAQRLAAANDEIIPPLWLPSTAPLLGALFSVLIYLCVNVIFPRWFISLRVFLDYQQVSSDLASKAIGSRLSEEEVDVLLQLDDTFHENEPSEVDAFGAHQSLVVKKLKKSPNIQRQNDLDFEHLGPSYFEMNNRRIYIDLMKGQCFDGSPRLHCASLQYLKALAEKGIIKKSQRSVALDRYGGYNNIDFAMPTVKEAFIARLLSPLVVIQLVGSMLSVLEDGALSLIELVSTLIHHYYNALAAIRSIKELSGEVQRNARELSDTEVLILQGKKNSGKWVTKTARDILPGDVFALVVEDVQKQNMTVPVDALVLDGGCLTNEAVLTGETVPQAKVPFDFEDFPSDDQQTRLDLDSQRQSILFSGTSIMSFTPDGVPSSYQTIPFPKDKSIGSVCLALRTGSYSSKGELLRSLQSNANMGEISSPQSEKDSIRLIAGLAGCAAFSCASLFWDKKEQHVSVFRRLVQCTRIAVSSIPSHMPLSIASVLRSSSENLKRVNDVVCSRPGALLAASRVNTVVFDKVSNISNRSISTEIY